MPNTMEVSTGTIRSTGDQGGDLHWTLAADPGGSTSLHDLRIKNGTTDLPTVQLQSGPSGIAKLRIVEGDNLKVLVVDGGGATLYESA